MRPRDSLPADYFERMFRGNDDPWQFETSVYEAAKYDATLAALGTRSYDSGLEIGCANGVLTRRLHAHCRALLAVDVSASALKLARQRCAGLKDVSFAEMSFPARHPLQTFDLIVMSEVVYYWSSDDIRRAGDFVAHYLAPGGDLLLVHWIGETDYPQTGDDAVNMLRSHLPSFDEISATRTDKYRLDLWRKP